MKTFEQRKKEIVEEIKDLQFATNPTEEKGLLWRWTKHGLNILSLYIDNAFSQSLSDYRKELGGELEKMKTSKYPERFSVQHPNICKYCGIKPGKEHLGSCDFLIETNRNYVLDSAISLLQKDKENKP